MNTNQYLEKTLVLMIHGGHSTGQRQDDQIQTREIKKNTYSNDKGQIIWTEHLDRYLDNIKFEILSPLFPNGHDFVYTEEERFMVQLLDSENYSKYKNIVLISHSMGTIFLQNFLAKHNIHGEFGFSVKQIHFVSPTRDFGDFKIDPNWENISQQTKSENIFIYHSKDDQKCEFADGIFYHENLSVSNFILFEDRGHFTQPKFPELIENIEKCNINN